MPGNFDAVTTATADAATTVSALILGAGSHFNTSACLILCLAAILHENVGFLVIIGVGLVMALTVTLMVKAETKWLGTRKTSEWFYTAGRTIKTGLIAASIVSAWTWAATLLQSSTVTFEFGVAGSFWYAAGACIQVILFSVLAVELKRRAPMTHTFAEMINVRYGRRAHKVFLLFGLMTNTLVTAMLVLGGAAVVNSLTGVDITLAAFLLPGGDHTVYYIRRPQGHVLCRVHQRGLYLRGSTGVCVGDLLCVAGHRGYIGHVRQAVRRIHTEPGGGQRDGKLPDARVGRGPRVWRDQYRG